MIVSEYWNALRFGAKDRGARMVSVPIEILLARLRYGLGPRLYSLFRLWRKPMSEWGDYVDDNFALPWLRRVNPVEYRELLNDKVLFFRRCTESDLPTVRILGVIGGEVPAGTGILAIQDSSLLAEWLRSYTDGLFIKPWGGSHGDGAFSILPDGSGARFGGMSGTVDQLFAYCQARAAQSGMLLVQPRVRPAKELRGALSPYSLGTVRAVTRVHCDESELLAACLRIPVGTVEADNFLQGASGNLAAAIDLPTGLVRKAFGSMRREWPQIVEVERHPDTGAVIEGFQLPYWPELVALVLRGQRDFSGLRTIGWDVAITEAGPVLVEGNCAYAFDLLQFTHDHGFRSLLVGLSGSAPKAVQKNLC